MSNGYFGGRAFQKSDSKTQKYVFEKQGKDDPLEKSAGRGYQDIKGL